MSLTLSHLPDLPTALQTVTLDGEQFKLRMTWRERRQAWYLDLYTLDGTALVLGRRVSPGFAPFVQYDHMPDRPAGFFFVHGLDGYVRGDLGGTLRVVYRSREEMAARKVVYDEATADPPVVISV